MILGRTTYEAVRERAEAEPIGELDVKGKSAAVKAYRLIDLR